MKVSRVFIFLDYGKKNFKSNLVLLVSLFISKGLWRMTEELQEPSLGVRFGMVQMGIFSEGSFISDAHTSHTPNPHLWLNKLLVHCSIGSKSQEAYIVFIPLGDGSFLGGGLSVGFTLFSPLKVLPWIFWLITYPSFFPLETLWKKNKTAQETVLMWN